MPPNPSSTCASSACMYPGPRDCHRLLPPTPLAPPLGADVGDGAKGVGAGDGVSGAALVEEAEAAVKLRDVRLRALRDARLRALRDVRLRALKRGSCQVPHM
jgi:hypothetical protein